MKKIKAVLLNSWTLGILSLLLFAMLVVVVGPLISIGAIQPLATTNAQIILITVVTLIWIIKRLVSLLMQQRKDKAMGDDLAIMESDNADEFAKEELSTLQQRFKEALTLINKKGGHFSKRTNIYGLPWYIIVGPPGSGKTTALLNSGLKFPLSEKLGEQAIQGVGGTRNCDWWFTDQAVMIDTAGRYVTQDSNKDLDASAWTGFLSLLKKYRKRQPINGVFIAISASDLLVQSKAKRTEHVSAIKQRIKELHEQLGIHFPIYVLITKSDLLAGFETFFADLDARDREQPWGMTFDLQAPSPDGKTTDSNASPTQAFDWNFDQLIQRLNTRVVQRVHHERNLDRAAQINAFPTQMQMFKKTLSEFLNDIFENTRYEHDAMLRGVYFTSGTQEGTPIDRLVNRLAQNSQAGFSPQGQASEGKSFFIKDVMSKIVFPEAGLAGSNQRFENKLAWLRRSTIATTALITLAMCGFWAGSYFYNDAYVDRVSTNLTTAQQAVSDVSIYDLDPINTLDALNRIRNASNTREDATTIPLENPQDALSSPWYSGFGLQQQSKLQTQNTVAYERVLNKMLLARLMVMLERQLANPDTPLTYQYVALRTYLMLGSDDHYDANEVNAFFRESWLKRFDRTLTREQRLEFVEHLNALFATRPGPLPMPLDQKLIEQTQANLRAISFDEQIYARIQQLNWDKHPQFSIYDAAGRASADLVFIRKSGKSLSEGIEPLYTKQVYRQLMNGEIARIAEDVLGEAWVYGDQQSRTDSIDQNAIIKRVEMRYLNDYKNHYRALLADIDILPFSSFDEASRVLSTLSGKDSPVVLLIEGVREQTHLSLVDNEVVDVASSTAVRVAQNRLSRMLGTQQELNIDTEASFDHDPVTREFYELNQTVKSRDSAPLPITPVLDEFSELYKFMSAISYESTDSAIPPGLAQKGNAILKKMNFMLDSQPDIFLKPLMTRIVSRSASLSQSGVVEHLNQMWASEVLGFCQRAIANRYPVSPAAESDIQLDDFAQFFGYGGTMDTFFKRHLQKYVDASRSPWAVRRSQTAPIDLSSQALRAFEKASYIKRAFFKYGSHQPEFTFSLTPKQMDAGLSRLQLNVDGQMIGYEFGPLLTNDLTWPGLNPGSGARLEMRQIDGRIAVLQEEGPWGWFRMLNKMQVKKTRNAERFDLTFDTGGYKAEYSLMAGASTNPYRIMNNMYFSCPTQL
ncbi:Uncharacterised protein [BD1-7 clade bacterium]|uniref:Type VI secretion system membrane subunit TssM n=1 Tax=BD1-7 clade bacterium TaxID=2029982 RepID=A0A5S9P0L9_9GAMM|nr:Uncharacterised protein [BD1-7 clade bacterium]CAA0116094.1 Uncharacterised protein [BD1-7 clade bacterium]CAA0119765.1 Uncharacterised protein [BD1-7 clade bacterium]